MQGRIHYALHPAEHLRLDNVSCLNSLNEVKYALMQWEGIISCKSSEMQAAEKVTIAAHTQRSHPRGIRNYKMFDSYLSFIQGCFLLLPAVQLQLGRTLDDRARQLWYFLVRISWMESKK